MWRGRFFSGVLLMSAVSPVSGGVVISVVPVACFALSSSWGRHGLIVVGCRRRGSWLVVGRRCSSSSCSLALGCCRRACSPCGCFVRRRLASSSAYLVGSFSRPVLLVGGRGGLRLVLSCPVPVVPSSLLASPFRYHAGSLRLSRMGGSGLGVLLACPISVSCGMVRASRTCVSLSPDTHFAPPPLSRDGALFSFFLGFFPFFR